MPLNYNPAGQCVVLLAQFTVHVRRQEEWLPSRMSVTPPTGSL